MAAGNAPDLVRLPGGKFRFRTDADGPLIARERDAQKRGAYRFEHSFLATPRTKAELVDAGVIPVNIRARRKIFQASDFAGVVTSIWNAEREQYGHGLKAAPSVRFSRINFRTSGRGRSGSYTEWGHIISLNPLAATYGTILHEIAHGLAKGKEREAHGPVFLGVLIGLYLRHSDLARPVASIVEEAQRAGLRVDCEWIQPTVAEAAA
jgi:hypothetical protein